MDVKKVTILNFHTISTITNLQDPFRMADVISLGMDLSTLDTSSFSTVFFKPLDNDSSITFIPVGSILIIN